MNTLSLTKINDQVLFEAQNERGHTVRVEGNQPLGGTNSTPSPVEYLVIAHMSCAAIEIVELCRKMRQPLSHIDVKSRTVQAEDQIPAIITEIHLHFKLYGHIKPEKAAKIINLAVEKYCTISRMIDKVAHITTSFEIFPDTENA